jgi:hypothetical protein
MYRLFIIPVLFVFGNLFSQSLKYPSPPEGWDTEPNTILYDTENLWDYINGAADTYVKNGFQTLEVKDYKSGDNYISVELYRFASKPHALGMYRLERPEKPKFSFLKDFAYSEGSSCNLLAGIYYVKINSNDTSEFAKSEIKRIAGDFYKEYGSSRLPVQYDYFIEEYRLKNSESFISGSFLGYDYFNNVYTCKFRGGDEGVTAFIIEYDFPKDAKKALKSYSKQAEFLTKAKEGSEVRISDPNNGNITLMWKGYAIFGVVNPDDMGLVMEFLNFTALNY